MPFLGTSDERFRFQPDAPLDPSGETSEPGRRNLHYRLGSRTELDERPQVCAGTAASHQRKGRGIKVAKAGNKGQRDRAEDFSGFGLRVLKTFSRDLGELTI